MQITTNLQTLLNNCTQVEQALDLLARTLYRSYPSVTVPIGIDSNGVQQRRNMVEHFAGGQPVDENLTEQFTFISVVLRTDIEHKTSPTPHLLVQSIGNDTDTPMGVYA